MRDKEYMMDILDTEKWISVNMVYAMNEASCDKIYKLYYPMFKQINEEVKKVFDLAYVKDFYKLEEETPKKIKSTYETLSQDFESSFEEE